MSAASRSPRGTAAEPEDLMRDFRGGGILRFTLIAIVIHAVVILATSVPWLQKNLMGENTASMTEEQKLETAVKEATASLQAIAKEHGVRPQDLGSRFGATGKPSTAGGEPKESTPPQPPAAGSPPVTPPPGGSAPPSAGAPPAGPSGDTPPAAPPVPPGPTLPAVDDNVDLFK